MGPSIAPVLSSRDVLPAAVAQKTVICAGRECSSVSEHYFDRQVCLSPSGLELASLHTDGISHDEACHNCGADFYIAKRFGLAHLPSIFECHRKHSKYTRFRNLCKG